LLLCFLRYLRRPPPPPRLKPPPLPPRLNPPPPLLREPKLEDPRELLLRALDPL
jgi:hypothetical protein